MQVFISHASEDKDSVARPLANHLLELGFKVWFDEYTLRVGDSLRGSIDEGLANSDHAIVILSPSFFAKEWPKRELDGLFAREVSIGTSVILPVWHKLTADEVATYSPLIADRIAATTSHGIKAVVQQIIAVLGNPKEVTQSSPKEKLGVFEELLHIFQLRSDDLIENLEQSVCKEIKDRFVVQENAIRLLFSVDTLDKLNSPQKDIIKSAFVPSVDPSALSFLKKMYDSMSGQEAKHKLLNNYEILTTTPVFQRPDFKALSEISGTAREAANKYVARYLNRNLIAAATSEELSSILNSPSPSLLGAMHILILGSWEGEEIFPGIPDEKGPFRKHMLMHGFITNEIFELLEQAEAVKEITNQGLSPESFNLKSPERGKYNEQVLFYIQFLKRWKTSQHSITKVVTTVLNDFIKKHGLDNAYE